MMRIFLFILLWSIGKIQSAEVFVIMKEPKALQIQEPFELIVTQPQKNQPSDCQVCLAAALLALNPDTLFCIAGCCLSL